MGQNAIDAILEQRRQAETPAEEADVSADKFYSILIGEGMQEHFLEMQFNSGLRTCFPYTDLQWFNYDPEAGCIDLEFGGFLITIKGRGWGGKVFQGLRQKRLAWVKEMDSEMQDHAENEVFIEQITITPPKDFTGEETADSA